MKRANRHRHEWKRLHADGQTVMVCHPCGAQETAEKFAQRVDRLARQKSLKRHWIR